MAHGGAALGGHRPVHVQLGVRKADRLEAKEAIGREVREDGVVADLEPDLGRNRLTDGEFPASRRKELVARGVAHTDDADGVDVVQPVVGRLGRDGREVRRVAVGAHVPSGCDGQDEVVLPKGEVRRLDVAAKLDDRGGGGEALGDDDVGRVVLRELVGQAAVAAAAVGLADANRRRVQLGAHGDRVPCVRIGQLPWRLVDLVEDEQVGRADAGADHERVGECCLGNEVVVVALVERRRRGWRAQVGQAERVVAGDGKGQQGDALAVGVGGRLEGARRVERGSCGLAVARVVLVGAQEEVGPVGHGHVDADAAPKANAVRDARRENLHGRRRAACDGPRVVGDECDRNRSHNRVEHHRVVDVGDGGGRLQFRTRHGEESALVLRKGATGGVYEQHRAFFGTHRLARKLASRRRRRSKRDVGAVCNVLGVRGAGELGGRKRRADVGGARSDDRLAVAEFAWDRRVGAQEQQRAAHQVGLAVEVKVVGDEDVALLAGHREVGPARVELEGLAHAKEALDALDGRVAIGGVASRRR